MITIEIARNITAKRQCYLVRERAGEPTQYDAKPYGVGQNSGWVAIDLFTASAIVGVFDALKPENQKKLATMPIEKAARVAMQLIDRNGA